MGNGSHLTTWSSEDCCEDMRDSEMSRGVEANQEDEKTERERPEGSEECQANGQGDGSESQ